jgi:hypothetical protein
MSDGQQPASEGSHADLIALSHAQYEELLALAKSVRKARVAIVGADADTCRSAVEVELQRARAEIVAGAAEGVSFVVVAGDAGDDELLGLTEGGALLLRPEDVAPLIDAYVTLWTPAALEAATRRAREQAKLVAVQRTCEVKQHGDAWRTRLAGNRASRLVRMTDFSETEGASVGGRSYLSKQEMLIQAHAREGRIETPHQSSRGPRRRAA